MPVGNGPKVSVAGNAPQLAGHPAVDAALQRDAAAAGSGCPPRTERDDAQLASFVWKCGSGRVYAATVEVAAGRQVTLSDLLTGPYASYLSSTAEAQFLADGKADASTSDLRTWYLTPAALVVVFPAGSVSFPISSLTSYLRDPALFG